MEYMEMQLFNLSRIHVHWLLNLCRSACNILSPISTISNFKSIEFARRMLLDIKVIESELNLLASLDIDDPLAVLVGQIFAKRIWTPHKASRWEIVGTAQFISVDERERNGEALFSRRRVGVKENGCNVVDCCDYFRCIRSTEWSHRFAFAARIVEHFHIVVFAFGVWENLFYWRLREEHFGFSTFANCQMHAHSCEWGGKLQFKLSKCVSQWVSNRSVCVEIKNDLQHMNVYSTLIGDI